MPRILRQPRHDRFCIVTKSLTLLLCTTISSLCLSAQETPPQGLRGTSTDSLPPVDRAMLTPLRTSTDTARMSWGRQEFSRYTSAAACDRAILQMQSEVGRDRTLDTIPYAVFSDTLSTLARKVAEYCGRRFSVESTNPNELLSLLRIALALGDSAKARAVLQRQLSLAVNPADLALRCVEAIHLLLDASPPRLADVRAVLHRLDDLGPDVITKQFHARVLLLDYWKTAYDRDSLRKHAAAAVALIQAMNQEQRDSLGLYYQPYEALLDLENEEQDLAAQEKWIDQAMIDVGRWRNGMSQFWIGRLNKLLQTRKSLYGKQTRSLPGRYWFNTANEPRPVPGRVSLLIRVNHTCGERCFPQYTLIRQLKATYGDALDITLITETRGFVVGSGPLLPAEEAPRAAAYFLEFLKLPVGLLVDEVPYVKRPDGRLVWQISPIGRIFNDWNDANAVLIDASSSIRWLGLIESDRDKRFATAAIDRVIR